MNELTEEQRLIVEALLSSTQRYQKENTLGFSEDDESRCFAREELLEDISSSLTAILQSGKWSENIF